MKKILSIFIVTLCIFSLAACSKTADNKSNTVKQTLTIGLMPSVDAIPLILADKRGYIKEKNVNVKYEIFKSAKDRDAAFQAGSLDGIIGDQVAVCIYQNAGFDVKIVSYTNCDFMLIAGKESGIRNISDIEGKSVAISEKTIIEYTLDKMLDKNSIDPQNIMKSAVPAIPTRLEMLRNNKVDVALLPEPFATLALKNGGTLLGKASEIGLRPTVLAFTQEAIDKKGNEISEILKAYDEAVEYINTTPISEYEDIVICTVGYPDDMKGKIVLPKFEKSGLPAENELKDAINWINANGLSKKTLIPKDLVTDELR